MSEEEPRRRIARESDDVGVRLRLYEERTDARLHAGSETMAQLKEQIAELTPKPRSAWPYVTFGFMAVLALAGWIWQAARYPERAEFEQMRRDLGQRIDTTNSKLLDLVLEQERTRGVLQRLEKLGERRR